MFESREIHLEVHKLIAQCISEFLEQHNFSSSIQCSIRNSDLSVQQMRFGSWQHEVNDQTQEERMVLYYHFRVLLNESSEKGEIPTIDW